MKNKEKCSCGCHKEIISAWYRENGVCCNCDILVKPITKPIGKEKIVYTSYTKRKVCKVCGKEKKPDDTYQHFKCNL